MPTYRPSCLYGECPRSEPGTRAKQIDLCRSIGEKIVNAPEGPLLLKDIPCALDLSEAIIEADPSTNPQLVRVKDYLFETNTT